MSQSQENKVIIDGMTFYGGLNQPRHFVKVNVDCWERIFDYLSLRDILGMSQTCQRMRQIGGYYFRTNFHGISCDLNENLQPQFYGTDEPIELERDDFLRFIDTASIHGELSHLRHYLNMNLLNSLTALRFWYIDLTEQEIGALENQQANNIERIELFVCTIHDNALQQLLEHCPKVECLRIERNIFMPPAASYSIFQQTYPELQQFQYSRGTEIDQIAIFMEQNPSIKWFNTDAVNLWTGGHSFLESKIQLDCLSVELYSDDIRAVAVEFENFLRTLYERGFYKKLHLIVTWPLFMSDYQSFLNGLITFDPLEMLCTCQYSGIENHMTQLKELHIREAVGEMNLETLAKNLKNLERLWIKGSNNRIILPFLEHSKSLKIAIVRLTDDKSLNLYEMNQERETLERSTKVLIGAPENIYLATKEISRNCNLRLIEITREESVHGKFEYISTYVEY